MIEMEGLRFRCCVGVANVCLWDEIMAAGPSTGMQDFEGDNTGSEPEGEESGGTDSEQGGRDPRGRPSAVLGGRGENKGEGLLLSSSKMLDTLGWGNVLILWSSLIYV